MPKDDLVYIGHMLDKAIEALDLAQGKSRADYDRDKTLQLALTFLIQVIGEAARHVSPGFRQLNPEVPWDAIMGMRHKIVHDYMDVDEDIVWDTVEPHGFTAVVPLVSSAKPAEACPPSPRLWRTPAAHSSTASQPWLPA